MSPGLLGLFNKRSRPHEVVVGPANDQQDDPAQVMLVSECNREKEELKARIKALEKEIAATHAQDEVIDVPIGRRLANFKILQRAVFAVSAFGHTAPFNRHIDHNTAEVVVSSHRGDTGDTARRE